MIVNIAQYARTSDEQIAKAEFYNIVVSLFLDKWSSS